MDPQLSLLMANQALAGKGDLVFDPFVGSGSLLVAAAKFGAYVRFKSPPGVVGCSKLLRKVKTHFRLWAVTLII